MWKNKRARRNKAVRRERRKEFHRHTERGRLGRGAATFPLTGASAFGVWPEIGVHLFRGKRRYGY